MTTPERFDTLVLGSGEGGKYLARHLARSGRHVATIKRRLVAPRTIEVGLNDGGARLMAGDQVLRARPHWSKSKRYRPKELIWACNSGEVQARSSSVITRPSARGCATTSPIRSVFQTRALCRTARQEKVLT